MLHSTLRRYVEALGGKLELVAEFPDRPRMSSLPNADPEKVASLERNPSPSAAPKRAIQTRPPRRGATRFSQDTVS
jgi:hypothetical protein